MTSASMSWRALLLAAARWWTWCDPAAVAASPGMRIAGLGWFAAGGCELVDLV
jgi:hypothetical protein